MRLLDLFCKAGGGAMGYHRAGFDEIVGIDIEPQKRYPFEFVQCDAMEYVRDHWMEFDAIHASPPCQAYTAINQVNKKRWGYEPPHPKLIEPTRRLLQRTNIPWVIENVPNAPLQNPVVLCGSMFGLGVMRHRLFETSFFLMTGVRCRHRGHDHRGVYGRHPDGGKIWTRVSGGGTINRAHSIEDGAVRMGIDWMEWAELTQAIPPAYTEYIGRQLLDHIRFKAS
jgi:DNA (cytosine-5)-methyltransferase 1